MYAGVPRIAPVFVSPLVSSPSSTTDLRDAQAPVVLLQEDIERIPLKVLHRDVRHPVRLAHVEHGDDVLADNGGAGPGLAQEPLLGGRHGGELGQHHLERGAAPQVLVNGQIDRAHAALSELLLDAVAVETADLARVLGGVEPRRVGVLVRTRRQGLADRRRGHARVAGLGLGWGQVVRGRHRAFPQWGLHDTTGADSSDKADSLKLILN